MKLKDMVMDMATRRVLLRARLMAKHPGGRALRELTKAVEEFEALHEEELVNNLIETLGKLMNSDDDNEETLS